MGPGFRRDAEKSGYRVNVPVVITEAGSDSDIETARDLFRAYAGSLPFSLDFQNFAAELDGLPAPYNPPAGCLLIARQERVAVGVVGLKPLAPGIAEHLRCERRGLGIAQLEHARHVLIERRRAVGVLHSQRTAFHLLETDRERAVDETIAALSAEAVGAMAEALAMTVEYAKIRRQFDRPIGSFQAIKHRCADLLLEVESLRSAVGYAAAAVAEDSAEIPVLASLVKAYASETYFHVAAENIQIHGGIGFTWEHDAHLYFKRAKASELFLGDGAYHRERLANRIGL